MKTLQFVASVMLMMATVSFLPAQSNFGEFKWGLTGGVHFASFNNLELDKEGGRVGVVGGAFMKIPLSHKASIRPELLFNMKGASLKLTDDNGEDSEGKIRLNYIELPVSLDFEFMGIIDAHAGIQAAYLLSDAFKIDGTSIPVLDDQYNKGEFGFHFGTGIDLGNIGVHVRFQQSLTSFLADGSAFSEPRNWGITLTAAYMFIN